MVGAKGLQILCCPPPAIAAPHSGENTVEFPATNPSCSVLVHVLPNVDPSPLCSWALPRCGGQALTFVLSYVLALGGCALTLQCHRSCLEHALLELLLQCIHMSCNSIIWNFRIQFCALIPLLAQNCQNLVLRMGNIYRFCQFLSKARGLLSIISSSQMETRRGLQFQGQLGTASSVTI